MKRVTRGIAAILSVALCLGFSPAAYSVQAQETEVEWAYDQSAGRLAVDYAAFLSQHDLVYNGLPQNPDVEGMPVANGRTGASVWQDKGIRMQLHSVDNAPNSAFSAAQVCLRTLPGLEGENFSQRLHLYDGHISVEQDNGFTAQVYGIPGTETMAIHVKDSREKVNLITFDIEMWKATDTIIKNGGTLEYEAWKTVNYFEKDGVVGFTKGVSKAEPFGYSFAACVDGAQTSVVKLNDTTARLYIAPPESGEYTIWMSAFSRYNIEKENTAPYRTTDADVFEAARQELVRGMELGHVQASQQFREWWHNFWQSSFLHYEAENRQESDYIENTYYLGQYHWGGASQANFPMHFMRQVYTALQDQDVKWNVGYWHFNQRAVYNGALAANHVDGFQRFVDFYDGCKDTMTEYTRQRFGYTDAMKTQEILRWDGYPRAWPLSSNPESSAFTQFDNQYVGWIYCTGPEVAENMYSVYKYTQNEELLEKYYDYMRRTVQFIVQWVRWDEASGTYQIEDSHSRENWWHINNSTPDNAAIRSLLPKFIEAAKILNHENQDAELLAKAADVLEKLEPITLVKGENRYAPYDIYDKTSTLKNQENPELEVIYPHNLTGLDHPDLQTAINSFRKKSFDTNIWSVTGIQAARLGLGNDAAAWLGNMIRRNQYRVTGFAYDGNGKAESLGLHTTAMHEMLLQSYDDLIRVFPAVPDGFKGAFTLLASGGFLVSSEYENDQVRYIALLSQHGGDAQVKIPWDGNEVLLNGQRVSCSDAKLTVSTQKDTSYLIQPVSDEGKHFKTTPLSGTANTGSKTAFGKTLGIAGNQPVGELGISYDFETIENGAFRDSINNNHAAIHESDKVSLEQRDNGSGNAVRIQRGGWLQVEHSATFSPLDNFELSFDLKTTDQTATLFDKCNTASPSRGIYMDIYNGMLRVIEGRGLSISVPATPIVDGKWHTVKLVYSTEKGAAELYFDGKLQADKPVTQQIPVVPVMGRLGMNRLGQQPFEGSFDNFLLVPLKDEPAENLPPVAQNDTYTLESGKTCTVLFPGVLENDTDERPQDLTAVPENKPKHGTLQLLADGGFTYTPHPDFSGTDSFTYCARDIEGQLSQPATVTLVVQKEQRSGFFEGFGGDFSRWTSGGIFGTPSSTTEQAHTGRYSYILDEKMDVISKTFDTRQTGQTVTIWLYDTLDTTHNIQAVANVSAAENEWAALGVHTVVSPEYYVCRLGGSTTPTQLARTKGWHELKWDYSSGNCKLYIDDTLITELSGQDGFSYIAMGDFWGDGPVSGMMFDDVMFGDPDLTGLPENIQLDKRSATIQAGEELLLQADAQVVPDVDVKLEWGSDNSAVASVDATGRVVANAPGIAVISVWVQGFPGIKAECRIEVQGKSLYSVTVQGGTGSGEYEPGSEVTVCAQIPDKMTFVKWIASGIELQDPNAVQFTFTMPENNVTLLAEFEGVHEHTLKKTDAKTPTCTETGYAEHWSCTVCGMLFLDEGGTQPTSLQEQTIPAAGHNWAPPTCTEPKTCTVCGQTEGEPLGHSFGEWQQTKAPTCAEPGEESRSCACGEQQTRPIAPTGHKTQYMPAKSPTCTETGNAEYWSCTVCGMPFRDAGGTQPTSLEELTIPAAGHNWAQPTCSKPKTCTVCGQTEGEALGHSFGEWQKTKAPTCTEAGEESRSCACGERQTRPTEPAGHNWAAPTCSKPKTCTVCGQTEGEALGHSFGEWQKTKAPTCTEAGEESRSCACGERQTRPTDPVEHTIVKVDAKPATEETEGNIEYYQCTRCSRCFSDEQGKNEISKSDVILRSHDSVEAGGSPQTNNENRLSFAFYIILILLAAAGVLIPVAKRK